MAFDTDAVTQQVQKNLGYRTGTFVPTLSFATAGSIAPSYAAQTGTFTKIGDRLFGEFIIALNTKGDGTGDINLDLNLTSTFLPVSSNGVASLRFDKVARSRVDSFLQSRFIGTTDNIWLERLADSGVLGSSVRLTDTDIEDTFNVRGSFQWKLA